MVTVFKKRYGLKYAEVWFPDSGWNKVKSDVVRLHCFTDLQGFRQEQLELQHTRLTDLTQSVEELLDKLSKNALRDIRKSAREDITVKHFSSEAVCGDPGIVGALAECYSAMFSDKGMELRLDTAAVLNCARAGALVIGVAYLCGEPVVYHALIDGKDRVICWHSCSKCRCESEQSILVGRANKRLHWEDLLYFKERGCQTYDWGGVFAFDSENGIDRFKMLFGGTPHDYYHTVPLPNSLLGCVALKAYTLFRLIRPVPRRLAGVARCAPSAPDGSL
jgi:hypothetical protein